MPAYSKTNWVDGSVPAIDATNLNKIEQGIFDSLRQDGSTTMSGQLVTTAGSAATPAIAPTGDSNTGIFFPAADTIAFAEGGTEAMRITSAGNVGIETTNPTSKLHVYANGGVADLMVETNTTGGDSKIALKCNGTGGRHWYFQTGDNASTLNGRLRIFDNTAGAERLTITSTGNVGIGTSSISSVFGTTVKVAGSTGATIETSATNVNLRQFVSDSLAVGAIGTSTNHPFYFLTNDAERMRITSGGNVGIGVNPNVELHVKGTGEIFRLETTAATGDNFIRFYAPSATTQGYVGYTSAANNNMSINQVLNSDLLFFTDNTERMRIQNSGGVIPSANNTYDLGSASFRWATIYAQNALNTSDARLKTDVTPSSLGLDFIASLNPVQYRWIEGGNTVEKVQTGTETVEISPAIPAQPEVMDEEGNIIQEATQEVPAVTEEKPIYETVVTPREGVRTHFGLIAQEVKAALPDGLDFAGWCLADKDDADSTQSLGYTQLIAPMIKAIQELKAEIEALKAQLNK